MFKEIGSESQSPLNQVLKIAAIESKRPKRE